MEQTIIINELPPGLNGSDGLMQMHWSKYRKLKQAWVWLMRAENPKKHEGKVVVTYTRCSTAPMDYDNLGASFKPVGDALEANGIVKDDSPEFITRLILQWEKAKTRSEQKTIIEITDVE